jgi:hypothetical protein
MVAFKEEKRREILADNHLSDQIHFCPQCTCNSDCASNVFFSDVLWPFIPPSVIGELSIRCAIEYRALGGLAGKGSI